MLCPTPSPTRSDTVLNQHSGVRSRERSGELCGKLLRVASFELRVGEPEFELALVGLRLRD